MPQARSNPIRVVRSNIHSLWASHILFLAPSGRCQRTLSHKLDAPFATIRHMLYRVRQMHMIVYRYNHVLEIREAGHIVAWFPIAVGSPATPTPEGVWTVAVGPLSEDEDVIGVLSTPTTCCLRRTDDLASLGTHVSGG